MKTCVYWIVKITPLVKILSPKQTWFQPISAIWSSADKKLSPCSFIHFLAYSDMAFLSEDDITQLCRIKLAAIRSIYTSSKAWLSIQYYCTADAHMSDTSLLACRSKSSGFKCFTSQSSVTLSSSFDQRCKNFTADGDGSGKRRNAAVTFSWPPTWRNTYKPSLLRVRKPRKLNWAVVSIFLSHTVQEITDFSHHFAVTVIKAWQNNAKYSIF